MHLLEPEVALDSTDVNYRTQRGGGRVGAGGPFNTVRNRKQNLAVSIFKK